MIVPTGVRSIDEFSGVFEAVAVVVAVAELVDVDVGVAVRVAVLVEVLVGVDVAVGVAVANESGSTCSPFTRTFAGPPRRSSAVRFPAKV